MKAKFGVVSGSGLLGALLAMLLELELRGLVRQLPGRRFLSAACKI